jgi:hypothetical protein
MVRIKANGRKRQYRKVKKICVNNNRKWGSCKPGKRGRILRMDIIFLWTTGLDNGQNNGVTLSGKYDVSFESEEKRITVKRNQEYVRNFWGENVQDCFAIVGENGAGKTILVNALMDTIRSAKLHEKTQEKFLLIYEEEESRELYFIYTEDFEDLEINVQENTIYYCSMVDQVHNDLNKMEVAYFHNALNLRDYMAKSRCKYDFSLSYQVRKHRETTYEMHYNDLSKDAVMNYFENETFRIIMFLYDYVLHDDLNIIFPIPRNIKIGIADDSYSDSYILEQVMKLPANQGKDETSKNIRIFNKGVDNITRFYGKTWINFSIKNLIFNVFKELCIPATIPSNVECRYQEFFKACLFLGDDEQLGNMNVFQCAEIFIENLRQGIGKDNSYIGEFENYVHWLEKNEDKIKQYEKINVYQNKVCLDIPIGDSTEEFVKLLIKMYSKVNFAFPFYEFSFGVSTGEYFFLSIFSNLYSMIEAKEKKINVFDKEKLNRNTRSLLLIFDEADLSLHPRWQRMFMKWLTDFCEHIFTDFSVKIIVTTHSPILLSDFPGNSVLYLKKEKNKIIIYEPERKNSFGCNIHSLFLNSFFLESFGTMGAFAEEKINGIAQKINRGEIEQESEIDEIEKIINYIGEGIIKNQLKEKLRKKGKKNKIIVAESEKVVIQETIQQLKKQKKHLEMMIKNLEETIYDKN